MEAGGAEIQKEISIRKTTMMVEEITSSTSSKRRKISDSDDDDSSSFSLNNSAMPLHNFKATDLKGGNSGTEASMSSNVEFSISDSGETSPSGELSVALMEESLSSSATERKISLQKSLETETPPAAEIQEFFSAAELYEQKRFTEKYNYDIVKDIPLEGQYKWIPLNMKLYTNE